MTSTLRLATLADLPAVLAIERASPTAPQWNEAVWRGLLQTAASAEPQRLVCVAADGEGVAGLLVAMLAGSQAEIESVAVRGDARRSGVGTMLCRHAMQWSAERGASEILLEVRSQNAAARALYAGLGFKEQGLRAGYYRSPEDDAVLLVAAL